MRFKQSVLLLILIVAHGPIYGADLVVQPDAALNWRPQEYPEATLHARVHFLRRRRRAGGHQREAGRAVIGRQAMIRVSCSALCLDAGPGEGFERLAIDDLLRSRRGGDVTRLFRAFLCARRPAGHLLAQA